MEAAAGSSGTATGGVRPIARACSIVTMSRPKGSSETGMSLKFARPSGIATIVKQSRTPVMRCPSASHQPQSRNQMTLPIDDAAPALDDGLAERPQGKEADAQRCDAERDSDDEARS